MAMTPGSSASIQRYDMVSLATTNSAPGFSLYLRNGHDVSELGAPKKSRQMPKGILRGLSSGAFGATWWHSTYETFLNILCAHHRWRHLK